MQTNNYFYFITIRPLRSYFFGGENTFNTVEVDRSKKVSIFGESNIYRTNYFSKSRKLPQQTALLGMLRHALLMYNTGQSLLDADGPTKATIVGKQSFSPGYNEAYGCIENLSPVFLCRKRDDHTHEHWLPAGFNNQNYAIQSAPQNKADVDIDLSLTTMGQCMLNGTDTIPLIQAKGFKYKEGIATRWKCYNQTDVPATLGDDDIFLTLTKVGVRKTDAQKQDSDDAFYKQTFSRLAENFAFGVYVTCNTPLSVKSSFLMPFGADQSEFKVSIQRAEAIPEYLSCSQNANSDTSLHKVVLLSDTYLSAEAIQHCTFMIAQPEEFRFIFSEVDKVNVFRSGAVTKHPRKLNLIKRGSILYTEKPAALSAHLAGVHDPVTASFKRIGYNHFTITK